MKIVITLALSLMPLIYHAQILSEGFENVSELSGWDIINVSNPEGYYTWQQGKGASGLGSQNGSQTSYIASNANATKNTGTISDWLILPVLSLKDGDKISFYTKAADQTIHPDRLEVRFSKNGSKSIPPSSSNDLGDYTNLILEINPELIINTYPTSYTQFQAELSGIGASPIDIRIAFRYYVTDGGPDGENSNGIAIDNVEVTGATLGKESLSKIIKTHFYNHESKLLSLKFNNRKIERIELYNLSGKKIMEKKALNTTEHHFNVSNLIDGVYIIKVSTDDTIENLKFTKF